MAVDLLSLMKIAPIFLVALASPGPDFLLISSLAMKRGRAAGLAGASGIALGNMNYAFLCIFGLSYMLARMAWLLLTIKIVGGLYLIYLGYQLWKASLKPAVSGTNEAQQVSPKRNPFVMGLMTNVTNPKALAFFTSVFALIVQPSINIETQIAIILLIGFMSFAWFSFVSLALSTTHMRKLYMRSSSWIDRIAGTFLALFGVKLLVSARN